MNQFFTSVNIPVSINKIGYADKVLLLGSCFADNIGGKFSEHYFQATVNPFGTLYNPASIATILSPASHRQYPIVEWGGMWHSMLHHGSFSRSSEQDLLRVCEESRAHLASALRQANTVIITFGTAWIYEYEGQVVANCHKIPANQFVRRCMTLDEIVECWLPIIASMPDKHWIFTLSPIRHIKDGLHANQLSKAILLQAIDRLCSNSEAVSYFPSYEIMMDELRDYRFYAEDMVHPSQVAVEYIWQRFVNTYMTQDTQTEMRTLHQLWRDRHHRFLHPESQEAQLFAERIKKRLQDLQPLYPWIE